MRNVLLVSIAFLSGGVLAWLLLRGDASVEALVPEDRYPTYDEELLANPHLLVKTGVLTVRASAPDGTVPFATEVGYRYRDRTSLLNAGPDGMRRMADAPIGEILVIARAPGYEDAEQPRTLVAGVPMEVVLKLVPKER